MSIIRRKGSEIFYTNIRHGQHRVRLSTGTTDREAAQKFHNELQVNLWNEVPVGGRTWGEACDLWLDAETRDGAELDRLAKLTRVYKDRLLHEVTAEGLEKALDFCKTPGNYTRYRSMLSAILNSAKKAGWIKEVPTLQLRKDKKRKPREWITQEQWTALLAELPKHMKPMATFAVETGLRQANVLNLKWRQVDVEGKRAWFEALEMKADSAITIPLNEAAVAVLKAQKGQKGQEMQKGQKGQEMQSDEWVFPYRGKPISEVKTAFIAACVRAGLGEYVDGRYKGFTWHGLRHTWATWHMQNGTPIEVLKELGGWADLRMVLNYAHHRPSRLASYADNNRKTT